jgi:transcriptional regulator with XRE-family HTH domain
MHEDTVSCLEGLNFTELVSFYMKKKGITQQKLSDYLNISTTFTNHILKGKKQLPRNYFLPVLSFLKIGETTEREFLIFTREYLKQVNTLSIDLVTLTETQKLFALISLIKAESYLDSELINEMLDSKVITAMAKNLH